MPARLRFLLVIDIFNVFAAAMFAPIYAIYVKQIGGGLIAASSTAATLPLLAALTIFISSRYADKHTSYKHLMIISYLLFAASYLGYLSIYSLGQLFIIQALAGIAYGIGTPSYKALYSQALNLQSAASAWGNMDIMDQLVTAFGAALGGILALYFGFPFLFVIMAILAVLSACFTAIWL